MSNYIRNWFSNFEFMDVPFVYDGISYWTAENFYQAMKSNDISDRVRISKKSPTEAKRSGRKVKLRQDWDKVKIDVMRTVLRHKFAKGSRWRERLDTELEPIVEINNWHDNFWGDCKCERCKSIVGLNCLGRILEEIKNS